MLSKRSQIHTNDEEEWERHRQTLRRLYIDENKPRKEVMSIMSWQYGFHKPPGFYERHFKKWGFRKNRGATEWKILAMKLAERKALGKASVVFCDGKQLSESKVQKRTSHNSYSMVSISHNQGTNPAPPPGFSILTPMAEEREIIPTNNLPFIKFQAAIRLKSDTHINQIVVEDLDDFHASSYPTPIHLDSAVEATSAQITVPTTSHELGMLQDTARKYGSIVLPTLRSLLPSTIVTIPRHISSTVLLPLKAYEKEHLKLLYFSAANNFAALEKFPIENVWKYLRTKVSLPDLIRLAPGPTTNALAEKLFTSSLCGGDVKSVEFFLENRYIDVNEHICTLENYRLYTPVELSALLQDCCMTKLLVRFQADVNKTANMNEGEAENRGALERAILQDTYKFKRSNPELVEILLSYGAIVTLKCIQTSIILRDSRVVEGLIRAGARDNHREWTAHGIFYRAFKFSSLEASTNIVNIMLEVSADLNGRATFQDISDNGCPSTVLDAAAQHGYSEIVRILLTFGARQSESTLNYVIQSGNIDLVWYLLGEGANINSVKVIESELFDYYETPFSEAIRGGNGRLLRHFKNAGVLDDTKHSRQFQAAACAAAEVGDLEIMQLLIRLNPVGYEKELVYACTAASEAGHEGLVHLIVDSGVEAVHSSVLCQAMERNWKELVRKIIDEVGFSTRCLSSISAPLVLKLAIERGDIELVKDLIFAGADINSYLWIAVLANDMELVQLLLDAGTGNYEYIVDAHSTTALSTAVTLGNVDMIRFLIKAGVEPIDEIALLEAASRSLELVHVLLEGFARRYPHGRVGYGARTLCKAIENNNEELVEEILMANPFVGKYSGRPSPLVSAIMKGNLGILHRFLDTGMNLNEIVLINSEYGIQTPLLVAIVSKNTQVVRLLIDQGADVNLPATRRLTRTPLQMAAEIGNLELVQLLIRNGAKINGKPAYSGGATALQLAAIGGFIGIAEELFSLGADINAPPAKIHGRTAIEGAIEHGRIDMVHYLINAGAILERPGHPQYEKAIQKARKNGHRALCQMLEEIFDAGH